MKKLYIKDKKKRKLIYHIEEKQKCLKCLKHNQTFDLTWWSRQKLSGKSLRSFGNGKTRCIITNRGKSVNQSFKLSRLEFTRWACANILPGVHTGSW